MKSGTCRVGSSRSWQMVMACAVAYSFGFCIDFPGSPVTLGVEVDADWPSKYLTLVFNASTLAFMSL
uniref:Uncharacterized protein n=1 Tax=Arabidopsis thaliana TaxID=3702 RepID=Q0WMC9_ARATH|nr:hypothetical protein [Arabidopsis thaliana]